MEKKQVKRMLQRTQWSTESAEKFIHLLFVGLVAFCGLCVPFLGCGNQKTDTKKDEVQPLAKHWEKPIPFQSPPEGLTSLSAEECGECHEEIYNEWKQSFHAQAWRDPQFQAEWAKDDSLWVCLNCHTPLQNQQEFLVLGKENGDYFKPVRQTNSQFDPELRQEAITCAVCHVRDKVVIGPYGNQEEAPHAVRKDPGHLSQQMCLSCHNVVDAISPMLVCTFQTGEEWKASPYADVGEDCISCHMPTVDRPLVYDGAILPTRKHTWVGSGIPKFDGVKKLLDGYVPGLDVQIVPSKQEYEVGEKAFFKVLLTNQRSGHFLPTGDPEYFITLNLSLLDKEGRILQDTTYRIGQEWQWWPEAKKLSDNRLTPLEQRAYPFSFNIPENVSDLRFQVILTNHRMTEENAESMGLLGRYPLSAVVFEKRVSCSKPQ